MLLELACSLWFALGAYVFWFFTKARDYQPLALDELALTWKLHKHQTGCKSSNIHDLLVRNDEVVGFKCECGHKFLQKRLITQRPKFVVQPDRLTSFRDNSDAFTDLGITYMNIQSI